MGGETTQAARGPRPSLHSRLRCCAGCWRAMRPPGHWASGGGAQKVGWLPGSIFRELLPFLKITIDGGN